MSSTAIGGALSMKIHRIQQLVLWKQGIAFSCNSSRSVSCFNRNPATAFSTLASFNTEAELVFKPERRLFLVVKEHLAVELSNHVGECRPGNSRVVH